MADRKLVYTFDISEDPISNEIMREMTAAATKLIDDEIIKAVCMEWELESMGDLI